MGRWEEPLLIVGGQGRSGGRAASGGAGHSSLGGAERADRARSPKEGGTTGRWGGGVGKEEGVETGEGGRRRTKKKKRTKRNKEIEKGI